MLLVCYSLLNSQNISINNSEKRLLKGIKKLQKLQRKRSNNFPMVSFIYNGSQITTAIASKPKSQNPKQYFKDKYIFFEFQVADH